MISASVYKNSAGEIFGFEVQNHGEPVVCAAASALTINCVNSLQKFSGVEPMLNYDEKGGFLSFEVDEIKRGETRENAAILLNSLELGLLSVQEEYPGQIRVKQEIKKEVTKKC